MAVSMRHLAQLEHLELAFRYSWSNGNKDMKYSKGIYARIGYGNRVGLRINLKMMP